MLTLHQLDEIPESLGDTVVTIGKFDGLHAGHRALLGRLIHEARAHGRSAVVVTFDRHPAAVFRPAATPNPILSMRQKLDLLGESGIDATLVLPFTAELARMQPEEFISRVLVERLRMRTIIVGRDFRFGAGGAGTVDVLREFADRYGYEVAVLEDECDPDGTRMSATDIRRLLDEGLVAEAARSLGRPHTLSGVVVHGAKRGRELGFPTANLSPDIEGLVPADGVYAGWLSLGDRTWPAAISIGNNPTFEGVPQRQVEAYVIDEDLDLYDETVEVSFAHRIRGMVRFDGMDALKERIAQDVDEARSLLEGEARGR